MTLAHQRGSHAGGHPAATRENAPILEAVTRRQAKIEGLVARKKDPPALRKGLVVVTELAAARTGQQARNADQRIEASIVMIDQPVHRMGEKNHPTEGLHLEADPNPINSLWCTNTFTFIIAVMCFTCLIRC